MTWLSTEGIRALSHREGPEATPGARDPEDGYPRSERCQQTAHLTLPRKCQGLVQDQRPSTS